MSRDFVRSKHLRTLKQVMAEGDFKQNKKKKAISEVTTQVLEVKFIIASLAFFFPIFHSNLNPMCK